MSDDTHQQLIEAATRLLAKGPGRWIGRGYGRYSCSSCGAERMVDYGDHEQPTTEKREPCSRTCPWDMLERAVALIQSQTTGHAP